MSNPIKSQENRQKSSALRNSKTLQNRKISLLPTLVIPFVIEIVTTVGLVGYLSFRNGEKVIKDFAHHLGWEITTRVQTQIQAYLEIPQELIEWNSRMLEEGILSFDQIKAARTYFWKQVQNSETISHIGFIHPDGLYLRVGWINRSSTSFDQAENPQFVQQLNPGKGNLYYYDIDPNGTPIRLAKSVPNYDVRQRPSYLTAVQNKKPSWTPIYTNIAYPSLLQIYATRPLYYQDGTLRAVLTCGLGLNQVGHFLQSVKVGRSGSVFILEPTGDLVATSLKEQPLLVEKSQELKRVKATESQVPIIRWSSTFLINHFGKIDHIYEPHQLVGRFQGEKYFIHITPFSDPYGIRWFIVVIIPEIDFMEEVNANKFLTIVSSIAAFFIALVIGTITAHLISVPIIEITEASQEIAQGNLDKRVSKNQWIKIDEIETLEESFNSMGKQLKESFETLEDKVKERTGELGKANQEIAELNEQLRGENSRMGAELNVAHKLQHMILPKSQELENIKELDITGFMESTDELGGDYYDVLHSENVVTIGIGDVTGHGLESSILMLMTQMAVRTLKESLETNSVKFLQTLNRAIYKNVVRMNSERNLTLAILNYSQGILNISGQHEEVIIVRQGGIIERIDTIDLGFPIGLVDEISDYICQRQVKLEIGDGIVLYTDGITEAENLSKIQYGLPRLCQVIREHWEESSQNIQRKVIADLRVHIGEQKVFDDMTLLVLKRLV